ncbi:MAG: magnesium protoporphyrin IX methyltransferase [Pseudomonadota bacterium]
MRSYATTRGRLEAYFDRTAHEAWARLMSDAPVSRIRATVRAGRAEMRAALLALLPEDLHGARVLDAGCGAGQLTALMAARGADVLGVDLSPRLLALAEQNLPPALRGQVRYAAGDMLAPEHGLFDYVVAMDSLIHYRVADAADALATLSPRVGGGIVFTVAPATPLLRAMHAAGKMFPKSDRSPAIVPVSHSRLARAVRRRAPLADWRLAAGDRVARGFYISQAMELRHP